MKAVKMRISASGLALRRLVSGNRLSWRACLADWAERRRGAAARSAFRTAFASRPVLPGVDGSAGCGAGCGIPPFAINPAICHS